MSKGTYTVGACRHNGCLEGSFPILFKACSGKGREPRKGNIGEYREELIFPMKHLVRNP